jgi:hypothetical protein
VPKFNCLYCAAACESSSYALYTCRRCGKAQAVPEPPPFFFNFSEQELRWIATVVQQAQQVVQEPHMLRLDIATERTLRDISSGLGQRLSGMTGGADPRIQDVVLDAASIGTHGYAIGRAVLGTLGQVRDLKAVVNYTSVPDYAAKLRHAIHKFRQDGMLKKLEGVSTFCLRDAYTRWVYYEVETRGLRDWSSVITAEIDKMLGDTYLLALIEETFYKEGQKSLKAQGMPVPEFTPMPGPQRKEPPPPPVLTPPPGSTVTPRPGKADDFFIAEPELELPDDEPPPPPPPATTTPKPQPGTPTPTRISSGLTSGMPAYIPGVKGAPPPASKPVPPPEEDTGFAVSSITPKPQPSQTTTAQLRAVPSGPDKYIECEFWVVDQQGRSFFAGFKFYDSAGLELPKERFLKYGKVQERDGKNWFENKLNITQFLRNYGDLIATVKHVVDPMTGETIVYSNTQPDSKPLREFFAMIQKEYKQA